MFRVCRGNSGPPFTGGLLLHRKMVGHRQGNMKPELPLLNAVDSAEVGDLKQANRGSDDDSGQCSGRQMLEKVWSDQQKDGDGKCANDASQLGTGSGGFCNRSTRTAAADRKPLKKPVARFAAPRPTISLLGSTWVLKRAAKARVRTDRRCPVGPMPARTQFQLGRASPPARAQ